MNTDIKVSNTKKYLDYIRLLALGIFVVILLQQQVDFYSQIAPANKEPDFVSQKVQSFNFIIKTLPPKGIYRLESDSPDKNEYNMYRVIAQYSLAPRIITDSLFTDTIIAVFPRTMTINNPQNPFYANRTQWTVLADNGAGLQLLKKNKLP